MDEYPIGTRNLEKVLHISNIYLSMSAICATIPIITVALPIFRATLDTIMSSCKCKVFCNVIHGT